MARLLRIATLASALALLGAGHAYAAGGNYVFDGGTRKQQAEVRAALDASSFPWGVVPAQVTIHIARGRNTESVPGEIWLDANLLDAGDFSWGVVQHEYAHQVDFFLLDERMRVLLRGALGGADWCYGVLGLAHAAYGCERFASTLTWSYWPSARNSLRPGSRGDESAAMEPARFRALMAELLGIQPAVRLPAARPRPR